MKTWIDQFKKAGLWLQGEADLPITAISSDTRELEKQKNEKVLFFARRGLSVDGHQFLDQISNLPCIQAFVVEEAPETFSTKKPVILVRDSTLAMALASKELYQDPTRDCLAVACTGTNGKTTTSFLLQSILTEAGFRTAMMGTVKTHFEDKTTASALTTPDFPVLQKTFSELKNKGANAFVFEASSHALDQRRLLGIELDAALFTNLTPEHLDYHPSLEAYYEAKRKLFWEILAQSSKKRKLAIVPLVNSYGQRLLEDLHGRSEFEVWSWGCKEKKSAHYLWVSEWSATLSSCELKICYDGKIETYHAPLVGKFNVENIAGVICFAYAMNIKPEIIKKALKNFRAVPGRLELVKQNQTEADIFIDFAHTPDALENVLSTLRPLTKGRLILVFGCGGDRDRQKRPKMGEIAELYADEIYVTSDNPRTEDPDKIISEILSGMQRVKKIEAMVDRRQAICQSLRDLKKGDLVLISGKGHETYQIIGEKKIDFDDRQIVQTCLEA